MLSVRVTPPCWSKQKICALNFKDYRAAEAYHWNNQPPHAADSLPALQDPRASPSSQQHPINTAVRYSEHHAIIRYIEVYT
jgi:hypothetical protein